MFLGTRGQRCTFDCDDDVQTFWNRNSQANVFIYGINQSTVKKMTQ